jgi:hypothetical protein
MQTDNSFYRKPLGPPCIGLSTPEGKVLFASGLAAGTMECFFPLIEQVSYIE